MNDYILKLRNDFTLIEKFDIKKANKLYLSNILDTDAKKRLKKYINNSMNGKMEVKYINDFGRLKTEIINNVSATINKGITQMSMDKEIKRNILKDIYSDIDIVNCHPNILNQICIFHKLPNKNINKIIQPELIEQLKKNNNINNKDYKELKMKLLYGGNVDMYNDLKIIQNEIKNNTKEIIKFYPTIHLHVLNIKKKEWNLEGTILSYIIQQAEKQIAYDMIEYFNSTDNIVGAYVYDGLHIEGNINKNIINKCEKHLSRITPFNIQLSKKEFINDILDDIIICENDKEASEHIFSTLPKNYLVRCDNRVFFNYDNIYIDDRRRIEETLYSLITNLNINKLIIDKNGNEKFLSISKFHNSANAITTMTYRNIPRNDNFYNLLWSSNIKKLCFKNQYWDFMKKKLCNYDNETFTTIKIKNDYIKPNQKSIDELYDKILTPTFNNDKIVLKYFLTCLSRAMAGLIQENKEWYLLLGFRNSGKGIINDLLLLAFEDYVYNTNSDNFLVKSSGGDSAKNLSWVVPTEFKRLVVCSEIPIDKNKTKRLDGNLIKKIHGGDMIQARVNNKDEINFRSQASYLLCANDLPPIDGDDCLSTCVEFNMPSQFVKNPIGDNQYKMDEKIKTEFLPRKDIINAFRYVIFDAFENEKPEMPDSLKTILEENKDEDDATNFIKNFIKTNSGIDFISINEIYNKYKNKYVISKKKMTMILKNDSFIYKRYKDKRGFVGIKYNPDNNDNDISSDDE